MVASWNVPERTRGTTSRASSSATSWCSNAPDNTDTTAKLTDPGDGAYSVMLDAHGLAVAEALVGRRRTAPGRSSFGPTNDAADSPESAESAGSLLLDGVNVARLRALVGAANLAEGGE